MLRTVECIRTWVRGRTVLVWLQVVGQRVVRHDWGVLVTASANILTRVAVQSRGPGITHRELFLPPSEQSRLILSRFSYQF